MTTSLWVLGLYLTICPIKKKISHDDELFSICENEVKKISNLKHI